MLLTKRKNMSKQCNCDFAPCGHDYTLEEKEMRKLSSAFMKMSGATPHTIKGDLEVGRECDIKYDGKDFRVVNSKTF